MKRAHLGPMLAAALAFAAFTGSDAEAQNAALDTARDHLSGDVVMVVGVNFQAIRGSDLWKTFMPLALASEPDAQRHLDEVKTSCKIDVPSSVSNVVVAVDSGDRAMVFVQASGFDEGKLFDCMTAMAKRHKDKKVAIKKVGANTEITGENSEKIYLRWIKKDVVAVTGEDAAHFDAMLTGKGAFKKSPAAALLAKTNSKAALWMAHGDATKLDAPGANMTAAYGAVDLAKGQVSIDAHLVMTSEAEAKKSADEMNKEITKFKASGQIPQGLDALARTLKVANKGPEVVVTMGISESEIIKLVGTFAPQMAPQPYEQTAPLDAPPPTATEKKMAPKKEKSAPPTPR